MRSSANELLTRFRERLELLRGNNEVTTKLLRQGYDPSICFEEAVKFFGTEKVTYLAIDGTEFHEDRLDMTVFYTGAFGYSGALIFGDNTVKTDQIPEPQGSLCLSAAIPLSEEYATRVSGESTEGGVDVDALRLPQSLMRFAEYYLAYSEIRKDQGIRVLLMDRSVSGDIAHISWKMREYISADMNCLQGYPTHSGKITKVDLELGRMLLPNPELSIPPPRSQFLKFAAMRSLMEDGPQTVVALMKKLNANQERTGKLLKDLMDGFGEAFMAKVSSESQVLELRPTAKNYWDRLSAALDQVADHIFNPSSGQYPLSFSVEGNEKWINTNDLDYFTLLTIYSILREAWKSNILLLGIVKDSGASELVKTVLPILEEATILHFERNLPRFESDKMLLQANSIVNSGIQTPWRTFEYDVCFRTINPQRNESEVKKSTASVIGAFKNVITCERMFVKSYFQLWSSSNDPMVRSHVFLYDRPCYPQYDMTAELRLENWDNVLEQITPAMHILSDSPMSHLVIGILQSMGCEPIPEALGHNYPLFLADKKAKWLGEESAGACTAAVELEIARSKLDQQILFENKFRDYRATLEEGRKTKNRRNSISGMKN